jgi:hypothetical protein
MPFYVHHSRSNATGRGGMGGRRVEGPKYPIPGFGEGNAREELGPDKWCCRCRQWLSLEAFRPRAEPTSVESWCRDCHAKANREWRAKNPEHVERYNAERRAEYRKANPLTTRPCVVCGRPMTRPANALVCGEDCRRQRKLEQRRRLPDLTRLRSA